MQACAREALQILRNETAVQAGVAGWEASCGADARKTSNSRMCGGLASRELEDKQKIFRSR